MKLSFDGKVADGKLKLYDQESFIQHVKRLDGKPIRLTLEKGNKRTNAQNRYYHGVVVKMIHAKLRELGHDFTENETHEFLKERFLDKKHITVTSPETGEMVEMDLRGSTTRLTTISMPEEFIEPIQRWAAEFLGVLIPDPNQTEWIEEL